MGRSFYIITALIGFLAGVAVYLVWWPGWRLFFVFLFLALAGQASIFLAAKKWTKKTAGGLRDEPQQYACMSSAERPRTPVPPMPFFSFAPATSAVLFLCSSLFLFCFFSFFVCLGLARAAISEHHVTTDQIDYYNGQKIELVGVITETDIRRDKAKYTIKTDMPDIHGDVLISLNKYPQFNYGDRVKIYGELKEPGEFDGFDYGNYLSRYDIYSVMYYPKTEVLETGQGNVFWSVMSWAQNKFLAQINKLLPEPHSSFEAGLLVGARKGIPDELIQKFNITGLTHIIAISGFNITIIIVFIMWALSGLPRKMGFVIAMACIVLFTLFVGASPAVVRASIMGILGLIALNYGRQNNIDLTILWAAALMVLWNPKTLWWDVGFQLSFAAVLGLIYVSPLFKKYAEKLPQSFGIREAILMTLSAQVMALPIIVYNFERLSLIAPISNLLVAFAIPPAMLFGFIAVVLSFIFLPLGLLPAYIAWGILSYIIKVIELTSNIPFASINISGMRVWMMLGYYVVLVLLLYLYRKKDSGHRTQDSADAGVED